MENAIDFIDWNELKGKEARGIGGKVDLGEVNAIGRNYVITKKGIASKDTFYIPKYMARGYDGKKLYFDVTEAQKQEFKRDSPPTYEEYARYRQDKMPELIESRVNVIEVPVVEDPDVVVEERVVVADPGAKVREPPVINWESTLRKGVRSMDGEPIGNVMALYPDSIHIETEGSKAGYDVPKEEVAGFDGAEVRLNVPIADMTQFLEHK